jgi:hypothetical protein
VISGLPCFSVRRRSHTTAQTGIFSQNTFSQLISFRSVRKDYIYIYNEWKEVKIKEEVKRNQIPNFFFVLCVFCFSESISSIT